MPKNIHTPRDELICGKIDMAMERAVKHQDIKLIDILMAVRSDAERMEAKLVSRKDEVKTLQSLPDAQGWLTIESAPRDGTVIRVKIDGMSFLAKWKDGFIDENEKECGGWTAHEEGLHPPCWTDGDCWASNDQGDCSAHPTHWMPQPAKDKSK